MWQNPDVTSVRVQYHQYLRRTGITLVTYEVKQFYKWTVDAVHEAASHLRFAHRAFVVLEWPKDIEFSLEDSTYKMDQIYRDCHRFQVSLATLERYHNVFRFRSRWEADANVPSEEDTEQWLAYMFERFPEARKDYQVRLAAIHETARRTAASV